MRLLAWLASTLILLSSCGVTAPPAPAPKRTIVLSWTASNAVAVNRAGGGYRVYYATAPITDIAAATVTLKDIPWTSGTTPATLTLSNMADGTYYFRILAYSSMVDPNTSATAISALSKEVSIPIP